MKKLLLILLFLPIIFFTNFSYASFPVLKKVQNEVIETPVRGDNNNRNILLLALAPIPLAVIAAAAFSAGSFGFIFGSIFGITAILSAIFSIYLNLRTNIYFWDWKNYFAMLSALVLGVLTLGWTVIIMAYGGIG